MAEKHDCNKIEESMKTIKNVRDILKENTELKIKNNSLGKTVGIYKKIIILFGVACIGTTIMSLWIVGHPVEKIKIVAVPTDYSQQIATE
jgi:hypothetical protein